MKQVENTYQQGDVILRKIDNLPTGKVQILSKSRLVLAHGESGHSHVVEETDSDLIRIGERMLMRLSKASPIIHEEHNAPNSLKPEPVMLSPGIWEVGRVREFDPFQEMSRQVID